MGFGARGRDQPPLHDDARGPRRANPTPLVPRSRSGGPFAGRLTGSTAVASDAGGSTLEVAGNFFLLPGTEGSAARRAIWRAISPPGARPVRPARPGAWRSPMRHR